MNNQELLAESNSIIKLFDNIQDSKNTKKIKVASTQDILPTTKACFFRVEQLAFDKEYPHREAFENVMAALDNEAFNFVYILSGNSSGVNLYIGIVQNGNEVKSDEGETFQPVDYGNILKNTFEGNFNGSYLKKVYAKELENEILRGAELYKSDNKINAGLLLGIPSANKKESGEEQDFQGIDRLINSMLGLEWRLVVICEPVTRDKILEMQKRAYELFNLFSIISKFTLQHSENESSSFSDATCYSKSKGKSVNYSKNDSYTNGKTDEDHSNSSQTHQEGITEGTNTNSSESKTHTIGNSLSNSSAVTMEVANKNAQDMMKYIDEELLERIKLGLGKGLFKTSVYYMAKEPAHAERLKVGLMSLFQGNKTTYCPLSAVKLNKPFEESCGILQTYQNQFISKSSRSDDEKLLLSRPGLGTQKEGMCTYLTASEISLLAGLPQTEVPGLALKEIVDFGLNEKKSSEKDMINLGAMVQRGRKLGIPFKLPKDTLTKHIFVAGVTGSGKTTTCHKLLSQAKIPFLVIEPVKTEYRTLINSKVLKDVIVFTLGDETVAPFRLNPFELIKGEVISSHIDMVKATFTTAFPMEASMPQILEEAIYECYRKKGWNIDTNENEYYGERAFNPDVDSFPILSDLLTELNVVVEEKGFSDRLGADYKGSLVSRLSNLTIGSKGAMLNCPHSVDFNYIINHNVIIEMEQLKAPEDKSLLMGFVLFKLSSAIKAKHKSEHDFRHLTLIEEAHRLLSKVEYGDSGAKKGAVETFTDLLAEVRKYGEGLVVVDQIPNKLASEVLKNTNTKIIHKILAKDDKEAVGDCMLMDDKQKEYLSALDTGNAIVFNENTSKPVHVFVEKVTDTNEQEVSDEVVKKRFMEKQSECSCCYNNELLIAPLYHDFFNIIKKMVGAVKNNYKIEKDDTDLFSRIREELNSKKDEKTKNIIWKLLIKRYWRDIRRTWNTEEEYNNYIHDLVWFFKDVFCSKDFDLTKESVRGRIRELSFLFEWK